MTAEIPISRLFDSVARERGRKSEGKVRRAIQYLLDEGKLDSVKNTRDLDIHGIDYLVGKGRKFYKLSVKSSLKGVNYELAEHPSRYRHRDILFVVPKEDETQEELAGRIMKVIDDFEEKISQGR